MKKRHFDGLFAAGQAGFTRSGNFKQVFFVKNFTKSVFARIFNTLDAEDGVPKA